MKFQQNFNAGHTVPRATIKTPRFSHSARRHGHLLKLSTRAARLLSHTRRKEHGPILLGHNCRRQFDYKMIELFDARPAAYLLQKTRSRWLIGIGYNDETDINFKMMNIEARYFDIRGLAITMRVDRGFLYQATTIYIRTTASKWSHPARYKFIYVESAAFFECLLNKKRTYVYNVTRIVRTNKCHDGFD